MEKRAKVWVLPKASDEEQRRTIAEAFDYHPRIIDLLISKGLTDTETIEAFTSPRLSNLSDPFDMEDMDKAVVRIMRAIRDRENILIHGDYDADGICATALLCHFFKTCSVPHTYYLPHRIDDGYGLSAKCVRQALADKVSLIITVDCGIKAHSQTAFAREQGIDIIVTDHHEQGDTLPDCVAVINPKRRDCNADMEELCGAGVAFKLVHALLKRGKQEGLPWAGSFNLKQYLDLVLLGTMADKVPLMKENRIMVRYGLNTLRRLMRSENTGKEGLRRLIKNTLGNNAAISIRDLLFRVIPQINASGRVDSPDTSIELLLTNDSDKGQELSYMLKELNTQRRLLENRIAEEVEEEIKADINLGRENVIVLASENWHIGVLGIIASRICEKHHRSVILFQIRGDMAKASGRMPDECDVSLLDLISSCKELLTEFGGHRRAAGVSIKAENIPAFRKMINENYLGMDKDTGPIQVNIDAEIELSEIDAKLIEEMELLEPFGTGNPNPIFLARNLSLRSAPFVIAGRHLKFKLAQGTTVMDALGFSMGHRIDELYCTNRVDVLFSPARDGFSSGNKLMLQLIDFRKSEQ